MVPKVSPLSMHASPMSRKRDDFPQSNCFSFRAYCLHWWGSLHPITVEGTFLRQGFTHKAIASRMRKGPLYIFIFSPDILSALDIKEQKKVAGN